MSSSVVWNGVDEYLKELQQLPDDCVGEAAKMIEGEVNGAYVTISGVYGAHHFTGILQKRLTIKPLAIGSLVYGLKLTSGSPIAWLFDNGSQARHWASGRSTGTMWGKTPPTHIFARTVEKARRKLSQQFRDLLLRRGAATVTEAA